MEISETIKVESFIKWLALFKACNGRFLYNPINLFGSSIMVCYTFDSIEDYKRFCEGWNRLDIRIVETRISFFRKLKNKLIYLFKSFTYTIVNFIHKTE